MPTPLAPSDPWKFHVRLDSLALATRGLPTITGTILVLNVAYTKHLFVRFTLDDWRTTSEVAAAYVASLRNGEYDKFEFHIPLPVAGGSEREAALLDGRRMEICVRYYVAGRENEVFDAYSTRPI